MGEWVIRNPEDVYCAGPGATTGVRIPASTYALMGFSARGEQDRTVHRSPNDYLQERIARLRELMGDAFVQIATADARRRAHDPDSGRHRLMALTSATESAIRSLRSEDQPAIEIGPVTELLAIVDLLERWDGHPAMPSIRAALVGDHAYGHALTTLAGAELLRRIGNDVDLQVESNTGATPDLHLSAHPHECEIEVKAPQALRGPRPSLGETEARSLIRKALHKAGRQITRDRDGILVLGGLQLSAVDLDVLRDQALRILNDRARPNIVAIAFVSIGSAIEGRTEATGVDSVQTTGRTTIGPVISTQLAANPLYSGPLTIATTSILPQALQVSGTG